MGRQEVCLHGIDPNVSVFSSYGRMIFFGNEFEVLMTCFSEMLSDIFTKVPGVLQYMVPMVWWGGFQAFFSGAIPSIATL